MRRRDVLSLCLIWGLLLGALAWALSTQFRWVQEAKPIQVQRPSMPDQPAAEKGEGAEPSPATATGVTGTIDDGTRAALAKGLGGVPAEPPKAKASKKKP